MRPPMSGTWTKRLGSPKSNENFIGTHQANYGFSNDNGTSSSTTNVLDVSTGPAEESPQRKTPEPTDPKKRGEKRKAESGWFQVEEDRNASVFVSGLSPTLHWMNLYSLCPSLAL